MPTKSRIARGAKKMPDSQMMQVQRELGMITESLKNADEYRKEVLTRLDAQNVKADDQNAKINDKIDDQNDKIESVRSALVNVEQSVKSTSSMLGTLMLEKCGDRLDKLEDICKNLPQIESEVMFWRRLLGGTFRAFWKIFAAILGSGAVGGMIVKFWPWH
jgi:chromosome segregation ATPase